MNPRRKPDKIDIELSKTYFGSKTTAVKPGKAVNPLPDKRPNVGAKYLISAALAVGIALSVFLLWSLFKPASHIGPAASKSGIKKISSHAGKVPGTTTPELERSSKNLKTLYDFEKGDDEWEIPSWELEKEDHVARSFNPVRGGASSGSGSMELSVEFPGGRWTGALVEIQQYLNLDGYDRISADIYLPPDCPEGLRGKIILTVGEDWRFVEMSRSAKLVPGEWTTITASISDGSMEWKRTAVDNSFREDVRKVAIRIESNNKPAYSGPILIDNIRVYSVD